MVIAMVQSTEDVETEEGVEEAGLAEVLLEVPMEIHTVLPIMRIYITARQT